MGLTKHLKLRWDSSDPNRSPLPLPLPPGMVASTMPNTSEGIQNAANRIQERARENMSFDFAARSSPTSSPEKQLVRTSPQRRTILDQTSDPFDIDRSSIGTPTLSTSRSPTRQYFKPILGENTPPSATVRALRSMPSRESDSPLTDSTNTVSAKQTTNTMDNVNAQLLKLTNIATGLQQEMSQLSRRSKDNAADLISLKDATKMRDDSYRKDLRDLMTSPPPSIASPRMGMSLYDAKPAIIPTTFVRAASHDSVLDTNNTTHLDGTALMAVLEKIIRDMATKDGHERITQTLSDMLSKTTIDARDANANLSQLTEIVKSKSEGLVRAAPSDLVPQPDVDMQATMHKLRDSIAANGGLTAEVKALLKDLRGEILGMGRELGQRLDQVQLSETQTLEKVDGTLVSAAMLDGVSHNLDGLRQRLEDTLAQHTNDISACIQSRHALSRDDLEMVLNKTQLKQADHIDSALVNDREALLQAVRSACQEFKPEIELQQFGLERDEILAVLTEGLAAHRLAQSPSEARFDPEHVKAALQVALQDVQFPQAGFDVSALKNELLDWIRECLEDVTSKTREADQLKTRDTIQAAMTDSKIVSDKTTQHTQSHLDQLAEQVRDHFKQELSGTSEAIDSSRDAVNALRAQCAQQVGHEHVAEIMAALAIITDKLATECRSDHDNTKDMADVDAQSLVRTASTPNDDLAQRIVKAIQDEFASLKTAWSTKLSQEDQTRDEALIDASDMLRHGANAFKDHLQTLHTHVEALATANAGTTRALPLGDADTKSAELPEAKVDHKEEFDNLTAHLQQLQAKVDAMQTDVLSLPVVMSATGPLNSDNDDAWTIKDDLREITDTLASLQETVATLVPSTNVSPACKADIDVVGALLLDTKTQLNERLDTIEEMHARVDQVSSVEVIAQTNLDETRALAEHVQTSAISKTDLDVLTAKLINVDAACNDLKSDVASGFDTLQSRAADNTSVDALGIVCTQIKAHVDGLSMPDMSALASKSDIERLGGMIAGLNENHEAFRGMYESDVGSTARALDGRKEDFDAVSLHLAEIKTALQDVAQKALEKHSMPDAELHQKIDQILDRDSDAAEDLPASIAVLTTELERRHNELLTHIGEQYRQAAEDGSRQRDVSSDDIAGALDAHTSKIQDKLQSSRNAVEALSGHVEEHAVKTIDTVTQTKDMTSELKISVDTLGTVLAGSALALNEMSGKMDASAQTSAETAKEVLGQLNEQHTAFVEGQRTDMLDRAKIIEGISDVKSDADAYQPRVLSSLAGLRDLLLAQDKARGQQLPMLCDVDAAAKDSASTTKDRFDQLDQVRAQLQSTAAELSALVAVHQTKSAAHENSAKDLLDEQSRQVTALRAELQELAAEKRGLGDSLKSMRTEFDALSEDKARLKADVAALNINLHVRREELDAMNTRADALERKVIEGLMDHSRAMLLTKPTPRTMPKIAKGRDLRNATCAPTLTEKSSHGDLKSKTRQIHAATFKPTIARPTDTGRRIMSLGPVSGNTTAPLAATTTAKLTKAQVNGLGGAMKRSHSVRTNGMQLRKPSWSVSQMRKASGQESVLDEKENENGDDDAESVYHDSNESETGSTINKALDLVSDSGLGTELDSTHPGLMTARR